MALPQLLTNTFIGGNVLKSIGIQDKNNAADIPPSEDTEFGYYIQDKMITPWVVLIFYNENLITMIK